MSTFAKVFGWIQFAVSAGAQIFASQGTPHTWQSWLTMIASGAAAVAIHGAASTDGKS